jgi:hypothetical protein
MKTALSGMMLQFANLPSNSEASGPSKKLKTASTGSDASNPDTPISSALSMLSNFEKKQDVPFLVSKVSIANLFLVDSTKYNRN